MGLQKADNVFLGMRVPNSAGIFHGRSDECGVALDTSVSGIIGYVSLDECTCRICFTGCVVDVIVSAKLIVELQARVLGGVCSFQGMTMDCLVVLNDILFNCW